MSVGTLYELSLQALIKHLAYNMNGLHYLQPSVKTKVASVMAKRGLLNTGNMKLVLHDGIVHLDLSECAVTSEGLGQVWRLCPRLRVVDLSVSHGCRTTLPASAYRQFFMHCSRLQLVNLRCCTPLDNESVVCLVRNSPLLVSLCLAGCHLVSDRSLLAVATYSRHLQVLDIANTKVSSEGLNSLANGNCSSLLKEVNISRCLNVTDEGIEALVKTCTKLNILVIHGCPLLTSQSWDITSTLNLKQLTWTVY